MRAYMRVPVRTHVSGCTVACVQYSNPTVKKSWCCGRNAKADAVDEAVKEKIEGLENKHGKLSAAGKAAVTELCAYHGDSFDKCWNVTTGRTVDDIRWTPKALFDSGDVVQQTGDLPMEETPEGVPADKVTNKMAHDLQLPRRMGELIAKTEYWCDVTSLDPPDGMFMTEFAKALRTVAEVARVHAQTRARNCHHCGPRAHARMHRGPSTRVNGRSWCACCSATQS